MITDKSTYLKDLGLTRAATVLEEAASLTAKMTIAYAKYRYISREAINRFDQKLYQATIRSKTSRSFQQLRFTRLDQYAGIPPDHVLAALMQAKEDKCFDYFEIVNIETVTKLPDPLLIGAINGCEDKFYITQWDNDVKIQDILQADEEWVKDRAPKAI